MLNLMCSYRVSMIMMNVHAVQLQHYTAIHMYAYTCIRVYRDVQCYKWVMQNCNMVSQLQYTCL